MKKLTASLLAVLVCTGTGIAGQTTFHSGKESKQTTTTAVEYYHAEFDHYFFTAIADEISQLDSGFFAGWVRTGRTFGIWKSDTGLLAGQYGGGPIRLTRPRTNW